MSDRVGHISASSISAFKACPTRYRLGYVESLRQDPEPQPLRFGTNWHAGLAVLEAPIGSFFMDIRREADDIDPACRITEDNRLDLAIDAAITAYETVPDYADPTEWAVERETIVAALVAYHWLYIKDKPQEYETVAVELPFELPCVNPETGRPTPNMVRVGKIDRIIRRKSTGTLLIQENKTTGKPIDSGSSYWQRLRLDTQSKFYIVAARDLQHDPNSELHPLAAVAQVSGLLHDVFHKPQISPKMLTQADSKTFVEMGEYFGAKFSIAGMVDPLRWIVNEVPAEVEPGKKEGTFAVRETPEMFGARLLQDMATRPDTYFARREVSFTDEELRQFEAQVWALQRNMNEMERTGNWFQNETSCESTYKCAYCPICYNNLSCCDGKTTPPGFRRLHVAEAEQTQVEGE